jgi:hypothetical protein
VPFLQEFENSLPVAFRKDQSHVITRNPDSDSDDETIDNFIQHQSDLFSDMKYLKNRDGVFC